MKKVLKQISCISSLLLVLMLCSCGKMEPIELERASFNTSAGGLEIHFLDVGQADATLLLSEEEAVLIDAGNRADGELILQYLEQLGVKQLDYLIFTHSHEDHIGSGVDLIEEMDIGTVYMRKGSDSKIAQDLETAIEDKNIEVILPKTKDSFEFGECKAEFVGSEKEYEDENDNSLSVKISHGENDVLFTGDAGKDAEKDMLAADVKLESELLQVGHHGSDTSSSYVFLREVNPKYAVISCGRENSYGHPNEDTLSRLNDVGAALYRTDLSGTIVAVSDKQDFDFSVAGINSTREHSSEPVNGEIEKEETGYIGNQNSKKFHRKDCSGLPMEKNRVDFNSYKDALTQGYEPCGICEPE